MKTSSLSITLSINIIELIFFMKIILKECSTVLLCVFMRTEKLIFPKVTVVCIISDEIN
jgi:hypothetical protein